MRYVAVLVILSSLCLASAATAAEPTIRVSVDPVRPLFGDTFDYVVEVDVDEARADAVRLRADVTPFLTGPGSRTTRSTSAGVVRITLIQKLVCLTASCVPRDRGRAVALPRAQVATRGSVVTAPALVVVVRPRVPVAAVAADDPVYRSPALLPQATMRADPGLLFATLASVAVFLLLGALGSLAFARLRGDVGGVRVQADPIARAIRLLRDSVARPSGDRRRAASLAARVVPDAGLAGDAARIAWSRAAPDPPDATALADALEDEKSRRT